MKKERFNFLLTALAVALMAGGIWGVKASGSGAGMAPYLCVGFGCGIFGSNVGALIRRRTIQKIPEVARQLEIEEKDERNLALRNRAQAKAYQIMMPVFGALFLSFGLMGVEMRVTLLLAGAYLFVCGCSVYYRIQYEKEM